jgi:hypothetical protein
LKSALIAMIEPVQDVRSLLLEARTQYQHIVRRVIKSEHHLPSSACKVSCGDWYEPTKLNRAHDRLKPQHRARTLFGGPQQAGEYIPTNERWRATICRCPKTGETHGALDEQVFEFPSHS